MGMLLGVTAYTASLGRRRGGGSGAEMRNRAARTEARGGGGGSGAEMRDQAEHVIAVMGEQRWRMKARKEGASGCGVGRCDPDENNNLGVTEPD